MAKESRESTGSTRDMVPGFGAALKARREAKGLSLEKLAQLAGTHFTSISKLERNQRAPSLRLALDLASALEVTLDVLIQDAARLAPANTKPETSVDGD